VLASLLVWIADPAVGQGTGVVDERPGPQLYTLFESALVRPLALSRDGSRLYAVNLPAGSVEVYATTQAGLVLVDRAPVGVDPVALALSPDESQLWVVNHISDSVTVLSVTSNGLTPRQTAWVGDEPRDIVFAGPDRRYAFITTARRGQHLSADPQLTTDGLGRADVWVFDSAIVSSNAPLVHATGLFNYLSE
jgi:DNA-binding beta-propeller fold protein YncE